MLRQNDSGILRHFNPAISRQNGSSLTPVCGGELKYDGDQVIMDNGTIVSWECESCGATGKEGSDIVFQRHFAVTGANGKPVSGRDKL